MESTFPHGKGQFWGEEGTTHCKVWGHCGHLCKTAEPIVMLFGLWAWTGPRIHKLDGGPDLPWEGTIWGKGHPLQSIGTFCCEMCKNGWTDRFPFPFGLWTLVGWRKHTFNHICHVAPMCPRESLRGWEGTLAPPSEYDWTVRLLQRCGLRPVSNYFDHFLLYIVVTVTNENIIVIL